MLAAAVLEIPVYVEASAVIASPISIPSPEERLRDLVHELRQPLSSIDAIAYYLEMTLPAAQGQARHYMAQLQRLVGETNAILERSVGTTRKSCGKALSAGA